MKSISVIVNDNEASMREVISLQLEVAGLGSVTTNGLHQTLEALRTHSDTVKLLVTDKDGSDGLELAAAVRVEFPSVRILMVSGTLDVKKDLVNVDAGLAKPYTTSEFLITVTRLISSSLTGAPVML